nr:MAG TPA: hypothetical protein [Caudoviricetes sp.]
MLVANHCNLLKLIQQDEGISELNLDIQVVVATVKHLILQSLPILKLNDSSNVSLIDHLMRYSNGTDKFY